MALYRGMVLHLPEDLRTKIDGMLFGLSRTRTCTRAAAAVQQPPPPPNLFQRAMVILNQELELRCQQERLDAVTREAVRSMEERDGGKSYEQLSKLQRLESTLSFVRGVNKPSEAAREARQQRARLLALVHRESKDSGVAHYLSANDITERILNGARKLFYVSETGAAGAAGRGHGVAATLLDDIVEGLYALSRGPAVVPVPRLPEGADLEVVDDLFRGGMRGHSHGDGYGIATDADVSLATATATPLAHAYYLYVLSWVQVQEGRRAARQSARRYDDQRRGLQWLHLLAARYRNTPQYSAYLKAYNTYRAAPWFGEHRRSRPSERDVPLPTIPLPLPQLMLEPSMVFYYYPLGAIAPLRFQEWTRRMRGQE
jgi:hypothetical protein